MTQESPCFAPAICAERLARIETKLDNALKAKDDQELRIRILERRDAIIFGACSIIAMLAPIIAKKVFGI